MELISFIKNCAKEAIAGIINRYNVEPYGYCPVQAEGHLPTGEYYYFRSRHESWSVRIAKNKEQLWDGGAWIYIEHKYNKFAGGYIDKLEVVRNFNKAIKIYYEQHPPDLLHSLKRRGFCG